jgi:hypothetical protein
MNLYDHLKQLLPIYKFVSLSLPLLDKSNFLSQLEAVNSHIYLFNLASGWLKVPNGEILESQPCLTGSLVEKLQATFDWILSQKQGLFLLENIPSYTNFI